MTSDFSDVSVKLSFAWVTRPLKPAFIYQKGHLILRKQPRAFSAIVCTYTDMPLSLSFCEDYVKHEHNLSVIGNCLATIRSKITI